MCFTNIACYETEPHNQSFNQPEGKGFWKHLGGKGENAGKQHFPLFVKYLLPNKVVTGSLCVSVRPCVRP